jgi:NAD(P)-dependent dehydrogenase (short-subunit alcohol dehydrogenase family)
LQGKICVITGATSGIGLAAAEALAVRGASLALIGRNRIRGEAALARVRAAAPGVRATVHYADLLRASEVRRLGADLLADYRRIDVLINNAGALFEQREITEDGLERTFALNHMAYFRLTQLLRDRLAASAPARVVNVASRAHEGAVLDCDDLNLEHGYTGWTAYRRSKLANILFTRELARRLAGSGVTATCLHPGFVASRFGDNNRGASRWAFSLAKLFAISEKRGAETLVYLASDPAVGGASGGYFVRSRPATPSTAARDDQTARRLWEISAKLAG